MVGHSRRAAGPGLFAFEIEGGLSRNRSDELFFIDNTGHPQTGALAQAKALCVQGFGLDLDLTSDGFTGISRLFLDELTPLPTPHGRVYTPQLTRARSRQERPGSPEQIRHRDTAY